ncbi:MAG: hypothetical protein HYS05_04955 [Acidobacteria bacterium]|nr:hypothetical protein [Acidobacteriota bacterium]
MRSFAGGSRALVVLAYAVVAVVFAWPLPLQLSSVLPGPVTGDTGVYVWNLWLFRHELIDHGSLPFFTSSVLSLTTPVDLSLHNYTVFANLLALPLLPWLGVVASFNVIRLAMRVLTAYAVFLLTRHLTGRSAESWLAGLLFAWSPVLVTRGMAHTSLVMAAPLPFFVLALLKLLETRRRRWAVAAGVTTAWAAMCDPYYGVYCLLLAGCLLAARVLSIAPRADGDQPADSPFPMSDLRSRPLAALDVGILGVGAVAAVIATSGGGTLSVRGVSIGMRSLYTPVLLLTILISTRLLVGFLPRLRLRLVRPSLEHATLGAIAAVSCALPITPMLYALARRLAEHESFRERVFWRSSPPGVDLASLVVPNPNHPMASDFWRDWLTSRSGAYVENVSSLTFVALVVLVVAWLRYGFRPSRLWLGTTAIFGALALGPFVTVSGLNTYVPGPWALLRYLPLIGSARTPARFSIVLMLGVAILFGQALAHITVRAGIGRRYVLAIVGATLVFELLPAPRVTYSAAVPAIYDVVARDPRDVVVLELPVGIRDGTSSIGDFNAEAQFFQTFHHKRIVGGYLSRVPRYKISRHRRWVMLRALMALSEGREISSPRSAILQARGTSFVERLNVGYVVVDGSRASPALRAFAIDAFGLEKIAESGARELFRPRASETLSAGAGPY